MEKERGKKEGKTELNDYCTNAMKQKYKEHNKISLLRERERETERERDREKDGERDRERER